MEILDNSNVEIQDFSRNIFLKIVLIGTVLVIVSTVIFATVRNVLLVQFPLPIAIIGTWVGIYYFLFDKYFEQTFLRKKKYSFTVGGAILATPALIYAFVAFITDEGYLGIIETILLLLALVFVAFLVGAILGGIMYFIFAKKLLHQNND